MRFFNQTVSLFPVRNSTRINIIRIVIESALPLDPILRNYNNNIFFKLSKAGLIWINKTRKSKRCHYREVLSISIRFSTVNYFDRLTYV